MNGERQRGEVSGPCGERGLCQHRKEGSRGTGASLCSPAPWTQSPPPRHQNARAIFFFLGLHPWPQPPAYSISPLDRALKTLAKLSDPSPRALLSHRITVRDKLSPTSPSGGKGHSPWVLYVRPRPSAFTTGSAPQHPQTRLLPRHAPWASGHAAPRPSGPGPAPQPLTPGFLLRVGPRLTPPPRVKTPPLSSPTPQTRLPPGAGPAPLGPWPRPLWPRLGYGFLLGAGPRPLPSLRLRPLRPGPAPLFASGSGPAPFSLLRGTPRLSLRPDPSPSRAARAAPRPAEPPESRRPPGSPRTAPCTHTHTHSLPQRPPRLLAPGPRLRLPRPPSSDAAVVLATRRLGMARAVSSPRAAESARRTSGAGPRPQAGQDARRPGLRGAPGRAGGGRGRGGGIPRRRRPARPLARAPS